METQKVIPSYKEGLKELRGNLYNMLSSESLALFDADANELEIKYQSILKLQVGDKAPDFTLSNAIGNAVRLSELLKKGKVILTFYRGTWCPYCSLQLNQYQQVLEEIEEKGAKLVAISPQTPDSSLDMQEKNALAFEVLSDNGNMVAKKFTTVFKNRDKPIEAMKALGIDFDGFYADDSRELPVPAVFIINQDQTIVFAKAEGGDYRNRTEVLDIIETL